MVAVYAEGVKKKLMKKNKYYLFASWDQFILKASYTTKENKIQKIGENQIEKIVFVWFSNSPLMWMMFLVMFALLYILLVLRNAIKLHVF